MWEQRRTEAENGARDIYICMRESLQSSCPSFDTEANMIAVIDRMLEDARSTESDDDSLREIYRAHQKVRDIENQIARQESGIEEVMNEYSITSSNDERRGKYRSYLFARIGTHVFRPMFCTHFYIHHIRTHEHACKIQHTISRVLEHYREQVHQ